MMKTEGYTPSVMEKLMGFDEGLYKQHQPVYGQRRALSDNYLRKSASIEKRSRKRGWIFKENATINDSSKNASVKGNIDCRKNGANGKLINGINASSDLIKFSSPAKIAVLRPNLENVKQASQPAFLRDSHTTFAWEFKKQLLERSKRTRVCQEIQSNRWVFNHGVKASIPDGIDLDSKQKPKLETRIISSNEGWKDNSVTKLPIFKCFNTSSHPNTKMKKMSIVDLKSRFEIHNINMPSTNSKNVELSSGHGVIGLITEQIAGNGSSKEGCFSCSSNASYEQDSPCEDMFTALDCVDINDELLSNTDEAYQPSPNSVLEPNNSSSSGNGDDVSTDLNGLWMKLQILKSEIEQNESKPGNATERSSLSENPGSKESQEFSYLVSVLNEFGFHGGNMEVSFERWHSSEPTMNSIFETLEKKYMKQESWSKTDRRLLFDRINLQLSEILRLHMDLRHSKNLRTKLGTTLRRDIVVEEIWKLLSCPEEDVNASASEKAVGKEAWLELADDVDSIVIEIEDVLFGELAMEFVAF